MDAIKRDWRTAKLTARERAICSYTTKLTCEPGGVEEEDLTPLRQEGLDDRAILDLAHIVGFFAHANRLADGLGCDLEANMKERE